MNIQESLTRQLLIQLQNRSITSQDRKRAALHVLDWISCVSLAKHSEVGCVFQQFIDDELIDSNRMATNLFSGFVHWQQALTINAALGNVLEMDDIHRSSILHPGPVVIPAALAMAERCDSNMQDFLDAVIWGYEITIRLGESIGRSHYKYFHNTATCATFGAALAASKILDLSVQKSVWALGNTGSQTGGLWQMRNEKVQTKQWHNSQAALAGTNAALLAKNGLSGPEYILEGPQGVLTAMSQDAEPEKFLAISENWRMYDCSFKPWPACRHAHPALDVISQTLLTHPHIKAENINYVEIHTYNDAVVFCDRPIPETELQAKFSIQHAVSALLLWGEPELQHYRESHINNEQIALLREKVTVLVDDEIEADYPFHYGAKCVMSFVSGERIELYHQDTLGDPERPMSKQQIDDKAHILMGESGIPVDTIKTLCSLEWADSSELHDLTKLLGKGSK